MFDQNTHICTYKYNLELGMRYNYNFFIFWPSFASGDS